MGPTRRLTGQMSAIIEEKVRDTFSCLFLVVKPRYSIVLSLGS